MAENRPTPVCWGHDQKRPIGKIVSWDENDVGLDVEIRLADTRTVPDAAMAWSMLEDGIITGWSVGFTRAKTSPVPSNQRSAFGEHPAREYMHSAHLGEVSAVVAPSVPGTAVLAMRSDGMNPLLVEYFAWYEKKEAIDAIFDKYRIGEQAEVDAIFARHGL